MRLERLPRLALDRRVFHVRLDACGHAHAPFASANKALLEVITASRSFHDLINDLAPSSWSCAAKASTRYQPWRIAGSPLSRSRSLRALLSPRSVSGKSVSPVCWPVRLQAVSPCLAR